MFVSNRIKGVIVSLLLSFLLVNCQEESKKTNSLYDLGEQFIKNYDISDVTKETEIKRDSLGELVLSLPNSLESRSLINEFGSRIRNNKNYSDRLLEYSIQSHDTLGIANAYLLQGNYYLSSLLYNNAYSSFCKAEYIFLQKKDSLNISYTLFLKATVLNKNGVYYEAEKQVLKSIKYNTADIPLKRKYLQYLTLGDVFNGLELFDDALYFYNQSLTIMENREVLNEVYGGVLNLHKVYVLTKIAVLHCNKGNYTKAEKILVDTVSKCIDLSNKESERYYGYLAVSLAKIKINKSHFPEAKSLLEHALSIGKKNKNRTLIHNAQIGLAEYYYLTERQNLATSLLKEVILEAQTICDLVTELKALELLTTYVGYNSEKYFVRYLEKKETLKGESSAARNDFIRIKNETTLLLKQNQELGSINKKLMILGGSFFVILIALLLLYLYRLKMRKLRIVRMFHKDTEEYYRSIIDVQNHLTLIKKRERKAMAKKLHDGVYSKLSHTRSALVLLENDDIVTESPLLVNKIVEVEQYIREMSHHINGEIMEEVEEFEQLLYNLILMQKVYSSIDFNIDIDSNLDLEKLNHRERINLYRSVQEVLANVIFHSNATKCDVIIKAKSIAFFEVTIVDDGIGFDAKKVKKGLGLINIKERIEMINGKLFLFTKKQTGTKVVFCLPY